MTESEMEKMPRGCATPVGCIPVGTFRGGTDLVPPGTFR
jgi:hypothetical protein